MAEKRRKDLTKFTVIVERDQVRALRVKAAWEGKEISELVREALSRYLGPLDRYLPKRG